MSKATRDKTVKFETEQSEEFKNAPPSGEHGKEGQ